jgi:hypothetical protein
MVAKTVLVTLILLGSLVTAAGVVFATGVAPTDTPEHMSATVTPRCTQTA